MEQKEPTPNQVESVKKLFDTFQDLNILKDDSNRQQYEEAITNILSSPQGRENSFLVEYPGGYSLSICKSSESGRAKLDELINRLRTDGHSQFKIQSFSGAEEQRNFEDDDGIDGENV